MVRTKREVTMMMMLVVVVGRQKGGRKIDGYFWGLGLEDIYVPIRGFVGIQPLYKVH